MCTKGQTCSFTILFNRYLVVPAPPLISWVVILAVHSLRRILHQNHILTAFILYLFIILYIVRASHPLLLTQNKKWKSLSLGKVKIFTPLTVPSILEWSFNVSQELVTVDIVLLKQKTSLFWWGWKVGFVCRILSFTSVWILRYWLMKMQRLLKDCLCFRLISWTCLLVHYHRLFFIINLIRVLYFCYHFWQCSKGSEDDVSRSLL